jgi:hypothetical protein
VRAICEWFGPRNDDDRDEWVSRCAEVLAALEDGGDTDLDGDWTCAIPPAWAFVRSGKAHEVAEPFVTRQAARLVLGNGDLTVLQGPLHFEGPVSISGTVVVIGDLVIDGQLSNPDPGDCLVVVGDERLRAAEVGWGHFVTGTLDVQALYWSNFSINDGLLYAPRTRAGLEFEEAALRPGKEPLGEAFLRTCTEPPLEATGACFKDVALALVSHVAGGARVVRTRP